MAHAEACLLHNLRTAPHSLMASQHILSASPVPMARFHAAVSMNRAIALHWTGLSAEGVRRFLILRLYVFVLVRQRVCVYVLLREREYVLVRERVCMHANVCVGGGGSVFVHAHLQENTSMRNVNKRVAVDTVV